MSKEIESKEKELVQLLAKETGVSDENVAKILERLNLRSSLEQRAAANDTSALLNVSLGNLRVASSSINI